ncbi:MAG: hypothetical protein NUW37_07860 [Planctomycetes bacterium]|nr:hypothetical protein [Planctomycetota bacterium]
MALKKVMHVKPDESLIQEMINVLAQEMQSMPNVNIVDDPPEVLVERGHLSDYRHYYVVWSRFDSVDDETRSRIIFDAIRNAFGHNEAMRATVTLGLTRPEASEMGISAGPFTKLEELDLDDDDDDDHLL